MTTVIPVTSFNGDFIDQLNANFSAVDGYLDDAAYSATSLASLKALNGDNLTGIVTTQYRTTAGDGGGGTWVWRSGNQSANVSADTQSGVWAAPSSDTTGASGAWQRQDAGVLNVLWFGAKGDGSTDDTTAIQAACNYAAALAATLYGSAGARARLANVYIPSGMYSISHLDVPTYIAVVGFEGTIKGPRTTIIKHTDPSQSCMTLGGRNVIRGLYFDVNNTNMTAPTAGPPTITSIDAGAYNEVLDCQFQFSYVAIGSSSTATNNAWVINNISGFVHHRMVYLKNTLDISYVSNLHSQNPEGTAWDTGWYSYNNKVLVEIDNCDGLIGENWFTWAGRGLFKHSGTGNLIVSVQNANGENITHGLEIASGSTSGQHVVFSGGYLQTNNRSDGVYLVSNEAAVDLRLTDYLLSSGQNANYVQITDSGTTTILGCTLLGTSGAVAFRKNSATSRLIIDDCTIRSFATTFSFDTSCDTLVEYGPTNRLRTATGSLYSSTPTGYTDITEPVIYEAGAGNTQQTTIVRRTPSSNHQLFLNDSLLLHAQKTAATGEGASLELSGANNNSAYSIGGRVRVKSYTTGASPGAENSRMWLQAYNAGAYGDPVVVYNDGTLTVQNSTARLFSGSGTPEGAVTAAVGSIYQRTNGASGSSLYVKQSGSGNTGWSGVAPVDSPTLSGSATISGAGQTSAAYDTSTSLGGALLAKDTGNLVGNGGVVVFGASQGYYAAVKGLISSGSNNTTGSIAFATRRVSTDSTLTEAMRIRVNGNVGIGGTGGDDRILAVQGNSTGATSTRGVSTTPVIKSDVTSLYTGYYTGATVEDVAFTLAAHRHFYAVQGTIGASATVTNQYGFSVDSTLTGATNNYGFHSAIASGTGRWNYFASGTANNAFAGASRFGATTAPVNTVDITGSLGRGAPVTKTGDFTLGATENWVINNKSGSTCTVTLPAASSWTGREVMFLNYQAQTLVSASSNVVPLTGGAAGTAILAATAGKWATLVSDGTNWIITKAG